MATTEFVRSGVATSELYMWYEHHDFHTSANGESTVLKTCHWQWKIMKVMDDTKFVKKDSKIGDNLAVLEAYDKSEFCQWRENTPLSRKRDMLNWLVQSKGQRICPHPLVLHQEPSLLQWACDLHYFDLDSYRASSCGSRSVWNALGTH